MRFTEEVFERWITWMIGENEVEQPGILANVNWIINDHEKCRITSAAMQ